MCLYDVVILFGTAESFTALYNICLFVLERYEGCFYMQHFSVCVFIIFYI